MGSEPVRKLGPFTADLHPHGFHGYWAATGGMGRQVAGKIKSGGQALNRTREVGTTGNRMRTRVGSGRAYHRGPVPGQGRGRPVTGSQPQTQPTPPTRMIAAAPLAPGVIVHVRDGSGAGRKIIPGRIATHHVLQGVHHVTVRTANGVKSHKVVPAHPKETKLRMHPARSSNRPKVSAYVDHQAIESWWAGSRGRFNGPLPAARVQSRGGSISKPRVRKDTMTVTEDLGHDGQSPVTIMQGGSRLERCPECGAKLSMDGQCPVHGNVLKGAPRTPPNLNKENTSTTKRCGTCEMFNRGKCWGYGNYPVKKPWVCDSWEADKVTKSFDLLELLLKEDGPVPSTGEALPGNTIMDPRGRSKLKNPDPNEPVPNYCNICGGTDGFHTPECPHYLANNGGGAGPAGLGA